MGLILLLRAIGRAKSSYRIALREPRSKTTRQSNRLQVSLATDRLKACFVINLSVNLYSDETLKEENSACNHFLGNKLAVYAKTVQNFSHDTHQNKHQQFRYVSIRSHYPSSFDAQPFNFTSGGVIMQISG